MAESDADLPKALIKRIVKNKLAQLEGNEDQKKEFQINKDALLAFSESAKVFITYIAATANDICKEGKRQIVTAEDVFNALNETEFPEFVDPLREHLTAHRANQKELKAKKKEESNKRKAEQVEKSATDNVDAHEDAVPLETEAPMDEDHQAPEPKEADQLSK